MTRPHGSKRPLRPLLAVSLLLSLGLSLGACKPKPEAARCGFCGMHIDPASAWRSEVKRPDGKVDAFDTPRCAFGAVTKGDEPKGSVVRVQEFYDRTWQDAAVVRFAIGSDVTGPMGADLVPLLPPHADKFAHDHAATKVVGGDQVTAALIAELR
jgi:nitrous oxide reductase accessory protein NosL